MVICMPLLTFYVICPLSDAEYEAVVVLQGQISLSADTVFSPAVLGDAIALRARSKQKRQTHLLRKNRPQTKSCSKYTSEPQSACLKIILGNNQTFSDPP